MINQDNEKNTEGIKLLSFYRNRMRLQGECKHSCISTIRFNIRSNELIGNMTQSGKLKIRKPCGYFKIKDFGNMSLVN